MQRTPTRVRWYHGQSTTARLTQPVFSPQLTFVSNPGPSSATLTRPRPEETREAAGNVVPIHMRHLPEGPFNFQAVGPLTSHGKGAKPGLQSVRPLSQLAAVDPVPVRDLPAVLVAPRPPPPSAPAPLPPSGAVHSFDGVVKRITFRGEDTGYCVLRVESVKPASEAEPPRPNPAKPSPAKRARSKDLVTVVGNFPHISVGQSLRFTGHWIQHNTYGRQLSVTASEELKTNSLKSMEAYLAGAVPGIGPVTAAALVVKFGQRVEEVLSSKDAVKRLMEVKGIGPKTAEKFKAAWDQATGEPSFKCSLGEI